ncbi:MaoC family dehydratase [Flavisphingomonas formosensis]|uniref:MaoC family dehydratase n=1 Tax=Flavisphingomonas formosensis TaxID=861534 RepID=UPI002FCCDF95
MGVSRPAAAARHGQDLRPPAQGRVSGPPGQVLGRTLNRNRRETHMAGVWFDELQVGQRFDHPIRRTLTETDNVLFTAMTHNPALLHLDEEYMKGTEFGSRIVNSAFTLGLMVGISIGDTTLGTAVANLGWDEVRFPKPLYHGDTIHVVTEVIELRDSKSRPDAGIVTFLHQAFNQRDELVASCKRSGLQRKKPKS